MKKLKVLSMSLILVLMMTACTKTGTSNSETGTDSQPTNTPSVEPTPSETESQNPVVQVEEGTEETAVSNAGKLFYTADEGATVSGTLENNNYNISFSGASAYNSVVFFYKASNVVTGNRYEVSLNINSKAVMQMVTVNGTVYQLDKGDNAISFRTTEGTGATVTIIMGEEDSIVTPSNEISISTPTVTDVVYTALNNITLDGDLSEWKNTKNEENTVGVVGSGDYEGKSVAFYASMQDDGLYIAAEVHHQYYVNDNETWWKNTNLEFFVGATAAQGWIAANGSKQIVTESAWKTTGDEETGYVSIVEGFIPVAKIASGSIVAGEIRLGLAWKTDDGVKIDKCNNGEANGGEADAYWVPKGTWPNNASMTYVTKDGIYRKSQVSFDLADFKTVTLDGNLNDWEGFEGVTLTGTEETSHKSVTWYGRLTSEGLFLAAKAHHDVFINDGNEWHASTNFEFWLSGGSQKYISANNTSAGGVFGTYTSKEYTEGTAGYETIFELVVPTIYLEAFLKEDKTVSVGFAFKTPGDEMTGGGANNGNADAWWILPGRSQTAADQQFIVTAEGLVDPLV